MGLRLACIFVLSALGLAQTSTPPAAGTALKDRTAAPAGVVSVAPGTHILLNMINSVSTKQALVGDRIYLETAFPVLASGRIVVPQGSWVTGTVTQVIRPGRIKGKGGLQVRFDTLTLPNGVTRDFRSDLGAIDPRENQTLNRENSSIKGPGNKAGDGAVIVGTTAAGAVIGGSTAGRIGGIAGAGAGAAAGLMGVLLTRGPDATLSKGSTVEMVLDRPLWYDEADLDQRNAPQHAPLSQGSPQPAQQRKIWPVPF